jgi:hypothetical protein
MVLAGGLLQWGAAIADPCERVPLCERQTKASVRYGALDTKGWAYYCTGAYPYYWNNDDVLGFGNNFSFDNKCFTVTENPFSENEPSKMDATITNWCFKHEDIKVTLGCSKQSPDIPCDTTHTGLIKDPGCPIVPGTQKNFCSGGPVPVCVQTWEEKCDSGAVYCTDDETVTWCLTCAS